MPRRTDEPRETDGPPPRSRRWFLGVGSTFAAILATRPVLGHSPAQAQAAAPPVPRFPGSALSPYGARSPFETETRLVPRTALPGLGGSFTPLARSHGIITPSSLHFERHHAGVPEIDPRTHTITIHGLVARPLVFTMDDLYRLPSESHLYVIECAGNSSSEWTGAGAPDVQRSHGLVSCSEWTGVRLATLLREAGVREAASWILAEGADACRMARSVPIDRAIGDALVAFGQNGEALRPEQGYPVRLVVPGCEGNISVKWLHRLEALDRPAMTRWETARYTDLQHDGRARQFTLEMDVKSVITRPSGGQRLGGAGLYEVSGLAWSGRGAIAKVDVTVDGGITWSPAALQEPRLPHAFTRFRFAWPWDGRDALIASRAEDASGAVQPPIPELLKARGANYVYHQHGIQVWRVARDGAVTNGNG